MDGSGGPRGGETPDRIRIAQQFSSQEIALPRKYGTASLSFSVQLVPSPWQAVESSPGKRANRTSLAMPAPGDKRTPELTNVGASNDDLEHPQAAYFRHGEDGATSPTCFSRLSSRNRLSPAPLKIKS